MHSEFDQMCTGFILNPNKVTRFQKLKQEMSKIKFANHTMWYYYTYLIVIILLWSYIKLMSWYINMALPLYKFCKQHRILRPFDNTRWFSGDSFQSGSVRNNYEYKSVPVEMSMINCSERRPHVPKIICKHKISCRNKRTQVQVR